MKLEYYRCYQYDVDKLLEKINPSELHSIYASIYCENDIYLIHAIYQTAKVEHLYRKDDIQDFIWKKLKLDSQYFHDFCDLFDYCWKQKFSKKESDIDKGKGKKLAKVVYSLRPIYLKLINSNMALLLFALAFIWLHCQISNYFDVPANWEWGKVAGAIFYSAMISEVKRTYMYTPLICFLCYLAFALFELFGIGFYGHPDFSYINLAKANVIKAFSYFLWYPIISINEKRIEDCGF